MYLFKKAVSIMALLSLLLVSGLWCSQTAAATDQLTTTITDYIGLTWENELVDQDVQIKPDQGLVTATATVLGPDGKPVPCQVSDVKFNEQGQIISMKVWFMASVKAYDKSAYQIIPGKLSNTAAPAQAASVKVDGNIVQLTSGNVGAQILNQNETFVWPVDFSAEHSPIRALILPSGNKTGPSTVTPPSRLKSIHTTIDAQGPLFSQVTVRYIFETGYWNLTFKAVAGIPAVLVHEQMDLGDSKLDSRHATAFMTLPLTSKSFVPTQIWSSGVAYTDPNPDLGKMLDQKGWVATGGLASTKWNASKASGYTLKDMPAGPVYTLTGWPTAQSRIGSLFEAVQPNGDSIGFCQLKSTDWRNPLPLRFEWQPDQGLSVRAGIQLYKQIWQIDGFGGGSPNFTGQTLFVPPTTSWRSYGIVLTKAQDEAEGRLESLAHISARTGSFRLQDVRHWFLDMPVPTINAPDKEPSEKAKAKATTLADQALATMQGRAKLMQIAGNFSSYSMGNHFTYTKHLFAQLFKPAADNPAAFTPENYKKYRALLAFEAIYQNSGESFPYNTGIHLNNPNMTVMAIEARAKSASLVQDHPDFKTWGKVSLGMMDNYLRRYIYPSGATFENPHYTLGVSLTWILLANNALMDANIGDGLDNPLFRKAVQFTFNWLTPPDARFSDYRVILPLGNASYQSIPPDLAKELTSYLEKTHHEKLASQFAWVANQTLPPKNQVKDIKPLEPKLGSIWVKDYGVFMRHGFGTPYETLFHMLAGKTLGHYENETDQMSYTLYAKGQPINLSFGNGYFPIYSRPWLRNRVSFDMKVEEVERNLIEVTNATFQPEAEYAQAVRETDALRTYKGEYPDLNEKNHGWTPTEHQNFSDMFSVPPVLMPLTAWHRQIAFLKDADPKGPNYFVIRDRFEGTPTVPTDLSMWFLANKMERKGDVFHFDGQVKIDADVFLHTPANAKVHTDHYGHQQQPYVRLVPDNLDFYPNRKRWEEQLLLRAHEPAGKGYLYVVYPRLKEIDPPATYERAGEQTVKVTTPLSTDTVTLAGSAQDIEVAGIKASGPAFAVRQFKDGKLKLVNFEGKLTGEYKGSKFTVEGAVTLDLSSGKPVLESKDKDSNYKAE